MAPTELESENRLFSLVLWIKLNENPGLYVTLSFIICVLKIVQFIITPIPLSSSTNYYKIKTIRNS